MKIPGLQEISLCVIVSNFERYNVELKDPNCRISWKHQEFLKRFLCATIFEKLKCERKLKVEYLDVLINPHIEELNLSRIDANLLPHIVGKLQVHGKSVVSLIVGDLKETLWEPLMSSLPNLETLYFRFNSINCSSILHICEAVARNCSLLKVVKFNQELSICKDQYDGISLLLKHCQYLEKVQYPDSVGVLYLMHANDVSFMRKQGVSSSKEGKIYALTSLSSKFRRRKRYPISDALEVCTLLCPYITQLSVEQLVDNTVLDQISCFRLLEHLRIEIFYAGITMSHFNQFLKSHGSKLISLNVPYSKCLSVVTLIESCPRLQSLQLNDDGTCSLRESYCEQSCKASLSSLKSLVFVLGDFKDQATVNDLKLLISSAKNVKKLRLGCNGFTNEFVRSLNLYHIWELNFSFTDIQVDPLKELLLYGSLQTLDISYCRNISKADYISLFNCLSSEQKIIKWGAILKS